MAGLSAAWLLSRLGVHVTLFEKGTRSGLSVHSRDFSELIADIDGPLIGDVPSRMFNASLWPSLSELYESANIAVEPVENRQTFYRDGSTDLCIKLPYSQSILKQFLNPRSRNIVYSLREFREAALKAIENGDTRGLSFGQFVDRFGQGEKWEAFLSRFLIPALTTTVFTCKPAELLRFPCEIVLTALQRIADSDTAPLLRTSQGSQDAAKKLLDAAAEVRLETPVRQVSCDAERSFVHTNSGTEDFDHVVIATQANHACKLVEDSLPKESSLLSRFPYTDVPVVVHTDTAVLPSRQGDWSTFNFETAESGESTCTVWMNSFHSNWSTETNIFHSIFPSSPISPEKVLMTANLQRPVLDHVSEQLHHQLDEYHSVDRNVWFAGSYAHPGVPLLESAVQSSRVVVERIRTVRPNAGSTA